MSLLRSMGVRVRALFLKRRVEAELDEELRFHLEQEVDKHLRAGLSPAEAHRRARIAFGGVERFKEQAREETGVRPLEDLTRDVRFAVRTLLKSPAMVLVTIGSLALGIGVSATVFAVGISFLFGDPGPLLEPESLAAVYTSEERGRLYGETSFLDYQDIRDETRVFQELAAHRIGVVTTGDPDQAERLVVELVTGNFFDVLGVAPPLGRGFLAEETRPGSAERVMVLSHHAWTERFDADPNVLGRTLVLDGEPFTVIGVGPEGLVGRYIRLDVDGWLPLGIPGGTYRATPGRMASRSERQFLLIGRLMPGRNLEEAQAEMDILASRLHQEHGVVWEGEGRRPRSITVSGDVESGIPPDGRIAFLGVGAFLLAGALLVLLLACTNVASLLLARAHRRSREMAIRSSLGARRGRLVRMLLSESLLLALVGGGIGLYLANLATGFVKAIPIPIDVPLKFDLTVDHRALMFTLVVSLLASVLAGIAPALQGSKPDLTPDLKSHLGRVGKGGRKVNLRSILVVTQVAAATVLLIGAGLAVRSLQAVDSYDPGLDPSGVAITWKEPPSEDLGPEEVRAYFLDLAARLEAHPDVESVALARIAEAHPLLEDFATARVEPEDGTSSRVRFNSVTPGYMEMLGMPLVRGRAFQAADGSGAPRVAVVNQAFVDRFLQGTGGVGERFQVSGWYDSESREARPGEYMDVIGVLADAVPGPGETVQPMFWTSFLQDPPVRAIFHARGRGEAEALVPILRREVPRPPEEITLIDPGAYQDMINYRFLGNRIASQVFSFGGAFALLLAFIGVFGIVSFAVTQRFREMAIRRAMGARGGQVFREVVLGGLRTTGVGIVLGLAVVVPMASLARSALLGVGPLDPLAVGGGVIVLVLASLLAGAIPARRLLGTAPMEVLRDE